MPQSAGLGGLTTAATAAVAAEASAAFPMSMSHSASGKCFAYTCALRHTAHRHFPFVLLNQPAGPCVGFCCFCCSAAAASEASATSFVSASGSRRICETTVGAHRGKGVSWRLILVRVLWQSEGRRVGRGQSRRGSRYVSFTVGPSELSPKSRR